MKTLFIIFCLVGYSCSRTSCGNCFPGTSASLCAYRKATDPIICGSDGRKYTPCTFDCVLKCIPNLRIAGCGSTCIRSTESTCPSLPPPITTTQATVDTTTTIATTVALCKSDGDAVCATAFVPPTKACEVTSMAEKCANCTATSPAKGACVASPTVTCTFDSVAPCNEVFIAPQDACGVDPASETCTTCTATSPAKGSCI